MMFSNYQKYNKILIFLESVESNRVIMKEGIESL